MSKNQTALEEGRITERDYKRMAVYKFSAYGNGEDLDVEADYDDEGLQKLTPTVKYTPAGETYPEVVAEIYRVFRYELEEEDLRAACEEWDGGSTYINYGGRWFWVPWGQSGGDFLYLEEVIYDTLGVKNIPGRIEVVDANDA